MKTKITLFLLSVFSVVSCKKNSFEASDNNIKNDSIFQIEKKQKEQDSLISIRKKNNANSILYLNRSINQSTNNISIDIFEKMLNYNISFIEDYLISQNWKLYTKDIIEKKVPNSGKKLSLTEKIKNDLITPGQFAIYRNLAEDSEIYIFQSDNDKKINLRLSTINSKNYSQIVNQIIRNNFSSKDGSSLNDPQLDLLHSKKYLGELANIESRIKFYKKNSFNINTFYYIKAPVISVSEDADEYGQYNFSYNDSDRVLYFEIEFYLGEK